MVINAQEDHEAAREKAKQVAEKLRAMKLRDAAELLESGIEETLSYFEFPREVRRRTRVVGAFRMAARR